MEAVVAFLYNKGINMAFDKVVGFFNDSPDTISILDARTYEMQRNLSSLVTAPYKNAKEHIRLGEIEKARDQLIDAIHKDSLNLPARLLYIQILLQTKRYDMVVEKYWDILDTFGYRTDIVPEWIADIHSKYTSENIVIANDQNGIELCPACAKMVGYHESDCYVNKIWFSQFCCAVQWKIDKVTIPLWAKIIAPLDALTNPKTDRYAICIANISTMEIIMATDLHPNVDLEIITNRYFVLRVGYVLRLYSSASGEFIKELTENEYKTLFLVSSSDVFNNLPIPTETSDTRLGNIRISLSNCTHTEYIENHNPDSCQLGDEYAYSVQSVVLSLFEG